MKRAALYLRVSTTLKARNGADAYQQDPAVQEAPLRTLATQRGWTVAAVHVDRISGAKERRPGLDALMAGARRGEFDVVLVWRFDRFARSSRQLVLALEEFGGMGIDFVSHQEALDTSTPMGKAMFTIIAAMAELERNIIRERVVAGIEHAKVNGTKSGKPTGRPEAIFDRYLAREMRNQGMSWRKVAAAVGAPESTVRTVLGARE